MVYSISTALEVDISHKPPVGCSMCQTEKLKSNLSTVLHRVLSGAIICTGWKSASLLFGRVFMVFMKERISWALVLIIIGRILFWLKYFGFDSFSDDKNRFSEDGFIDDYLIVLRRNALLTEFFQKCKKSYDRVVNLEFRSSKRFTDAWLSVIHAKTRQESAWVCIQQCCMQR